MRTPPFTQRLKNRSCLLLLCLLQAAGTVRAVSVLTQHNDNNRSGANLLETTLTTANVNAGQFGKLFSDAVDDQIYTQPLYVPGVAIAGGTHNVVYVATMSDSVYAFDADSPGAPLWHVNFTNPPSVVPVNHTQVGGNCGNYQDISGNIGILGTPVINGNVIYLVARTFENGSTFVQKLHALDIRSGAEMANSPVLIQATAPGTGAGSVNGTLTFDPQIQNQRAALGFFNNTVYIFYSSHCDTGNYHGWMLGYNGTTLQQTLVSDTTPNGGDGSIWESGQGPAIDANGNFYFMTGNGVFDVSSGGSDLGDSFVKLGSSLNLLDWFTPFNQATLDGSDADLGCGGLLLIPGTSLVTGGGKEGRLYLVNGANMGHFNASTDQIPQEFFVSQGHEMHGGPVYWNGPNGGLVYLWVSSDNLKAFPFANGLYSSTSPSSTGAFTAPGTPGGMLSLSANGNAAGTGILWAYEANADANQAVVPGTLRAFDATNVATELWDSGQNPGRDAVGNFAKFTCPTVANGKVYLATFSNQLLAYGLLPTVVASTWRVNAGGPAYTDSQGQAWGADGNYSGGASNGNANAISGTNDPTLYQTEHWGSSFSYAFNVPAGSYQVSLKFAEIFDNAAGQRIFNVSINGAQVLTNFDIFAEVGANKADDKVFNNIQPSNGQIVVQFASAAGSPDVNAKVSALQIVAQGGTPTPSPTPTPTVAAVSTWRVNSGGPAYTDSQGHAWAADENFSGGNVASTTSAIAGTTDPTLYQSERWASPYSYSFPVPAGSYQVTLKFAEFVWSAAGQRVFNVSINGTQVLTNFDIFAEVGANKADDKVFNNIQPNASGQIVVQLGPASVDNAKLDAVQIIPMPNPATATPSPTPTATPAAASTWRVNSGGPAYTDSQGHAWAADENFSGGNVASTTNAIAGTTDPTLYQSERWASPYSYSFPVPAGSYQVTLKFAEFVWSAAGQRVFNVSINGTQVLTNFDIFAEVGANKADDKVFNNIQPNASGQIVVQLGPASVDNAKLDAVQIIPMPNPATATPTPSASPMPSSTPTPAQAASTWRVHSGGGAYTDSQGHAWAADVDFSGGNTAGTASAIAGTADQPLYQTERWGSPFSYSFPVATGSYQITLKFAEIYWTAAGQRVFNVSINGTQVLTNFDIFAEVGANKADDKVFNNIQPNAGGQIVVQLGPASVDNAKLAAVQIVPQPGLATATATPVNSATSTRTPPPVTATNTPRPGASATNTPPPAAATATYTRTATPTNTRVITASPTSTFTASPTATPLPPNTIGGGCNQSAITLDGLFSEPVWATVAYQGIAVCSAGTCPGNGGSGQFKAAWDTQNLYVAVDVNDSHLSASGTNPWDCSTVELFLDVNGAKGAAFDVDDYQWIIRYDSAVINQYQNAHAVAVSAATTLKGGGAGYDMEIKIPWANLGVAAPSSGSISGLDVAVDYSGGATRDHQLAAWANGSGFYTNPSTWGAVSYVACPGGTHPLVRPQPTGPKSSGKGAGLTAYPNPSSGDVTAVFSLPQEAKARLTLFSLGGDRVRFWDLGGMAAGSHSQALNVKDLPAGIYFLGLQTDTGGGLGSATLFKMALLR